MGDEKPRSRSDRSPDQALDVCEPVVLSHLLRPPQEGIRIRELAEELHDPHTIIEAAVGRLVAGGLAYREGDVVHPSEAARYYYRLDPMGWA